MNRQEYVDAIKTQLINRSIKSAYSYLISKIAFLAWGPLAPLIKLVLERILKIFIYKTELAMFFKFVDLRTSEQGRAFSEALINNHKVQEHGSEEEKKIAEENLKNTFDNLVKLTC